MNLEKVRFEDNILEFRVGGEDHTYLNILREQLSQMPEVQFAAYKFLQHEAPLFYLRTEKGQKPIEIVALASQKIIAECDNLLDQVKKISKNKNK